MVTFLFIQFFADPSKMAGSNFSAGTLYS